MENIYSYYALESLEDLSVKVSKVRGTRFGKTENLFYNQAFDYPVWYGRINLYQQEPLKNELAFIRELYAIAAEPGKPKFLTFQLEDVSESFERHLAQNGFQFMKAQKGMVYDLHEEHADEVTGPIPLQPGEEILEIGEDRLEEFAKVGEAAFGMGGKLESFRIQIQSPDTHFYLMTVDGQAVAAAMMNVCASETERMQGAECWAPFAAGLRNAGVHEVATLPEHQGHGYATRLMQTIIQRARREGVDMISLQASLFGEPIYLRLGFKIVSFIRNYRLAE